MDSQFSPRPRAAHALFMKFLPDFGMMIQQCETRSTSRTQRLGFGECLIKTFLLNRFNTKEFDLNRNRLVNTRLMGRSKRREIGL